jgi:D-alanyl-D-alanine carboxypeptidase/D-alanyl-D-alanine-endopeptidase (penicillin-binding protein 4)
MRRPLILPLALVALLAPAAPSASAARPLPDAVRALVAKSPVGDAASVSVRDGSGAVIAAVRPNTPRLPASNQKILTIATALDALGPEARLATRLVASTEPAGGVVEGDVWLVGGGDPTFSSAAFADAYWGIYAPTVDRLAAQLAATGVTRITGRVNGDASRFDTVPGAPGWKPEFIPQQSSPVSALTVDRAASAPALRAARAVRRALVRAGIAVGPARVAKTPAPADGAELARVESAPVEVLAELAGRDSDNFVAEMLLKAAAAEATGSGTTAAGVGLERDLLAGLGVPDRGLALADGSGLSYDNRATAAALSLLLARVDDDPELGPHLRDALATAGVNGTLAGRMRTGPAAGLVQAKTGTLADASALSGYAGDCAFSVLVQRTWVDQPAAHALQDRIAQLLARRSAEC